MSLSPGNRLGAYEILGLIGAGGMGEVYKAHDIRLNRDVALKILPDSFANDPDRLARFRREAQVLASLNHPNIAAIYGFEESNGLQALVLELVEGPTLADRIARGAIPLEEAVPIATQIADALEGAHEQAIVHRDLKPANIKVRDDGTVKVLDFGLAKALQGDTAAADVSQSPTLSVAATRMGVILGTAAYMSPEQARGKAVDKRTDIWAFGCVLYEMLTGRRAFLGDDISDTLAGILRAEPDWNRLPGDVPRGVLSALRRCLEKDPRARIRDIGDVRLAIEGGFDVPVQATPAATSTRGWRREQLTWSAAALLAIMAAAGLAAPYFRTPATPSEMRLEINTPGTSDIFSFAVSPDGSRLVFVASGDGESRLWLRPLDAATTQPLPGTEGAAYPFWSPDNRSVAFFAGGKLKRIDIGGGLPQTLADAPTGVGGTWNADGVILFAPFQGPLIRVPASGGDTAPVTKIDPPRHISHRFPQFLPGGRRFLFFAVGIPDAQGIYVGSLDSSEITRLMAAETPGVYAPSGWLLFLRQEGTLMARRFNHSRGELTGDQVKVADAVGFDGVFHFGAFSVSPAGLMAYRAEVASRRQLTWLDRTGKVLGTLGLPDNSLLHPEVSPDGRRVVVDRSVDGNTDLWILDAVRAIRFTFDAGIDHWPIWSPEGSRVVFDSSRKGLHDLYQKPSSGAASEELFLESPQSKGATDWSPDGRFLLFQSNDPNRAYDLWTLALEGDRRPQAFLSTGFDEGQGQFSPDGRWVAYVSNESSQYQVYVRPFPGPGGQWQISTAGGTQPRWRPDGKELYYVAPNGSLMAASIAVSGATLDPGTPTVLFQTRMARGIGAGSLLRPQYDVAPDGRFLINVTTDEAVASPITVVLNWTPN